MSDGAHDDPYACLRSGKDKNKRVRCAEPSEDRKWFRCPACKTQVPPNVWVSAHLSEGLSGKCEGCGITLNLPRTLPDEEIK